MTKIQIKTPPVFVVKEHENFNLSFFESAPTAEIQQLPSPPPRQQ